MPLSRDKREPIAWDFRHLKRLIRIGVLIRDYFNPGSDAIKPGVDFSEQLIQWLTSRLSGQILYATSVDQKLLRDSNLDCD